MSKSLFLNVWYKCNYDCVYCVIWWIQEEFNSEDFVSFEKIKEIDLGWYTSVWLTWWEPTIHPDFFEILEYFKERWLDIFMQTNGSMLWNDDFFEKIKKYNKISTTRITLDQTEITDLLHTFAKQAKIPIVGGILKAAVGDLVISAVISEFVGSRFIINKITPYSIIQQ